MGKKRSKQEDYVFEIKCRNIWRYGFSLKLLFISVGLFFVLHAPFAENIQSIHCMGNGNLCVYGEGINILQLFGPSYSTPSFFKIELQSDEIQVETRREPQSAIYTHTLYKNGKKIGTMTDFVSSKLNCFFRISHLKEALSFSFTVENLRNSVSITDYPRHLREFKVNNSFLVSALPGVFVYHNYPCPFEINYQILSKEAVHFTSNKSNNYKYNIEFGKGEGVLYIIGGPSFPELNENLRTILSQPYEELLTQTQNDWNAFLKKGTNFSKIINDSNQHKTELLQAIDDISVAIKTQQGKEGGVLAGHYYHLGYVRDGYGVSRALLALGFYEEAKKMLNFYHEVWRKFGYIHNAQAIGIPGIFHKHENDEVEITGYLLMQAFDYLEKTKDKAFIKEIMPLLEWSWEVQKKNLLAHMLPFNGDETYIAGGLIPRKVLNDGSAESTLLFIEGGRKFLKYVAQEKLKDNEWLNQNTKVLNDVIKNYRTNFMNESRLIVNNPKRAELCTYPAYRYGVCLYQCHGGYRGILKHYRGSLYFCKECYGKADNKIEPEKPEKFLLPSVYLMPIYLGATLFTQQEKNSMLNELIAVYEKTGHITINQQDNKLLGYDYGMFLYALTEFDHPLAAEIYKKMMHLRDETGTWCEYYQDERPSGCRYRPWESGINIEAAINYVLKNSK